MHNSLTQLLNSFDPITPAEIEGVKLLNRMDTKFPFHYNRLPVILNSLQEHYKILDINGIKQSRHETLYFDTPDFKLYHDHHNRRTNRYKIRYRKYVDSGLIFFEVKLKNGKGRTIKSRVEMENVNHVIEGKSIELLKEKTPLVPEDLQPKLWVSYSRITLVNKKSPERLTLDINLNLRIGDRNLSHPNLIVAEVKQGEIGYSPFFKVMKTNHLRKGFISKYCFGVVSLIEGIKMNEFKSQLLNINKICHENKL